MKHEVSQSLAAIPAFLLARAVTRILQSFNRLRAGCFISKRPCDSAVKLLAVPL